MKLLQVLLQVYLELHQKIVNKKNEIKFENLFIRNLIRNLIINMSVVKYIHFHNNTDLPICIDSWVDYSDCLSKMDQFRIEPREKRVMYSSVGEWHLNCMFNSCEDRQIWEDNGFSGCINIGKFRSNPCVSGDYSWMEDDLFECVYSELQNPVKGVITFSIKNTTK